MTRSRTVFNLAQHRVEIQGSRANVSPVEQWGQDEGCQDGQGYGDQDASGVNALGKGSKGSGKGKRGWGRMEQRTKKSGKITIFNI